MVYCGIDIGTTNFKGIALGDDGKALAAVRFSNSELSSYDSGDIASSAQATKGDDCWYQQFCKVMDYFHDQGVLKDQKVVCCVGSQGGSFVLIDDQMTALGQVNLWTSNSAQSQVENYLKHYSGDDFYRMTGWTPASWMPVFKLKEIDFETGQRVAFVSDYIYGRLTGELITDITNAQITGLADFKNGCWDKNLINWAGLYEGDLPDIKNKLEVLFKDIATKWGKIDLVTSLHDQYAAMNAAGLKAAKDVMLATGTAWVINFRSEKPVFDNACRVHPGRDIVTGGYGNICSMSFVGAGFDKLLEHVGFDYNKLGELQGELNKIPMPNKAISFDLANISVCGLEPLQAVRNYMVWAASNVRYHLESLGLLDNLQEIVMTGGAGRSGVWPEIIADICGVDVKVVLMDELTAYGAAIVASIACGDKTSFRLSDIAKTIIFKPEKADEYGLWYKKFQKELFE